MCVCELNTIFASMYRFVSMYIRQCKSANHVRMKEILISEYWVQNYMHVSL